MAALAGTVTAMGSAATAAGASLFKYNRKNFMYDRKMRLELEYQIMEFKIKKAELFREDVRDIIGLTSVKMDTYLIVNAVQLGFCVMMFCEGRLGAGTPNWLVGCHALSLAAAFTYLLMSVWLSMHATIAAKSYEVRLLTQLVRLPVPSWSQLEGARTYASSFEKLGVRQPFRVPFWRKQETQLDTRFYDHPAAPPTAARIHATAATEDPEEASAAERPTEAADAVQGVASSSPVAASPSDDGPSLGETCTAAAHSADPWGLERPGSSNFDYDLSATVDDPRMLQHIDLIQEAMRYWQSYDAFARVSMSVGTNQLVTALCYYVLGYVLVANHAIIASWLAVLLFLAVMAALLRLDLSLEWLQYFIAVALVVSGPILTSICTKEWAQLGTDEFIKWLMPLAYVTHAVWMLFVLHLTGNNMSTARPDFEVALPAGFRSVLYMDVFGWIKGNSNGSQNGVDRAGGIGFSPKTFVPREREEEGCPGTRVAFQMGLEMDQEVMVKFEEDRGVGVIVGFSKVSDQDKVEVRWRDGQDKFNVSDVRPVEGDGLRPWKVFCGATSLFAVLWLITGILVSMELHGMKFLVVTPLTRDEEAAVVQQHRPQLLQFGQELSTKWPHKNVHTLGLACSSKSNTAVALSQFALYTADLALSGGGVEFKAAPLCPDIEGESLNDVSLHCRAQGAKCEAAVLTQEGQQMVKCNLTSGKDDHILARSGPAKPEVSILAEDWLNDADPRTSLPEHVLSVTLSQQSTEADQDSAYVGTSGRRIVEMRPSTAATGHKKYFPHRLLQAEMAGNAGSMHVVNDRYLALLQDDGQHLQVLDLKNGGAVMNRWVIPRPTPGDSWSSMCATGDNLFFLAGGQSPQLWRFPVPESLRATQLLQTGSSEGSTKARRVNENGRSPPPRGGMLDPSLKLPRKRNARPATMTLSTESQSGYLAQAKQNLRR